MMDVSLQRLDVSFDVFHIDSLIDFWNAYLFPTTHCTVL
jgi:hypothetical protein